MEFEWKIAIGVVIFFILIFLVLFGAIQLDSQKIKRVCELKGGEYEFGHCYIKEDGIYTSYKIVKLDDNWRLVR